MSRSRWIVALGMFIVWGSWTTTSHATGLLVPTDPNVECLSIVYQRLDVKISEQAAVTRVEQEFRNHTSKPLEAYYLFPLPKEAGVKDFAMWIDGKKITGEVVEADKARKVYEDVVRRLKDPGLLEHMGQNLWRVRVYPVPANGTQKIEISYSELLPRDAGISEYHYPLRAGNKAFTTENDFTVRVELHSQTPLKSVYSPSHEVSIDKKGDHKAIASFEQSKYTLNRDFRLYWTVSDKDVGLSTLQHRPDADEDGYFLALISPPTEAEKLTRVPRDLVFIVDTSGSMNGEKMEQAKGALKFCLNSLKSEDRFAVVSFSTTVASFKDELVKAEKKNVEKAVKWVDELSAQGGTAIDDALKAGFEFRKGDDRNFTVVFLTDGLPTIGETNVGTILKNVQNRNTSSTRIFAFGVGDDVNTHFLDQLSDQSRATSVYVRPSENIETKVSNFYSKISHPVLTDLALSVVGDKVKLKEVYPPHLPDLFHGSQLTVLGRYSGKGDVVLRLTGNMGEKAQTYDYEVNFSKKQTDHDFVAGIWARRKVGFLLDQIRLNGEKSELVEEVVRLAKKFGIATPYTSFLVLPDEPTTVANPGPRPTGRLQAEQRFLGIAPAQVPSIATTEANRGIVRRSDLSNAVKPLDPDAKTSSELRFGSGRSRQLSEQAAVPGGGQPNAAGMSPSGQHAVEYATQLGRLKKANEAVSAARTIGGKTFLHVDGIWIDETVTPDVKPVELKYLGSAYFKLLELRPELKEIFALGEHVLWVSPTGQAIFITTEGRDEVPEEELKGWLQK